MSKKNKTNSKKPLFKKWWFWLLVVLILGSLGKNNDSGESGEHPDPSIVTTDPVTVSTYATTPTAAQLSVIDAFIDNYNNTSPFPVTDISDMDIQGDDYRTEFRLAAFENAIGKKGTVSEGTLEVVNYGVWKNDQIRVYAYVDTYESAFEIVCSIIHIFDPTISPDAISEEMGKSGSFTLGSGNFITGYIGEDYADGGVAGYEIMVDSSKIPF